MKNVKYYVIIFFSFFLISLVVAPLRSGIINIGHLTGFKLSSLVGFIINYLLTYYFINKYRIKTKSSFIFFSAILGASILDILIRILTSSFAEISIPEAIIRLMGVFCAYLTYLAKNKRIYLIPTTVIGVFCIWMPFMGYDFWLHKLNYGSYTGRITNNAIYDFNMSNIEGDTISLQKLKGKYVLLDFWNSHCGICYRKFPVLNSLSAKYKDISEVKIYSVHVWLEDEDKGKGNEILRGKLQNKYTFPNLSISRGDSILKQLGVKRYPTVLVFDKENGLIFRGDIEGAILMLDKLLNEQGG